MISIGGESTGALMSQLYYIQLDVYGQLIPRYDIIEIIYY